MSERSSDQADAAAAEGEEPASDSIGEIIRTIIYAVLIALLFRTLFFQPFSIPSGSMKPTLLINDYLFVSKYSYGYSKYAVPYGNLLPDSLFGGRILSAEPKRGDVIVFRNPRDANQDYIKRLVGLPGDVVQMKGGVLYINGEPAKLRRIENFVEPRGRLGGTQACVNREVLRRLRLDGRIDVDPETRSLVLRAQSKADCIKFQSIETLPGGVSHPVLDADGPFGHNDNTRPRKVPEGHYFFVGDNRDNSADSRVSGGIGFVPRQNLIGRAEIILLSAEGESIWRFWNWRSDRFFKVIE